MRHRREFERNDEGVPRIRLLLSLSFGIRFRLPQLVECGIHLESITLTGLENFIVREVGPGRV